MHIKNRHNQITHRLVVHLSYYLNPVARDVQFWSFFSLFSKFCVGGTFFVNKMHIKNIDNQITHRLVVHL